MTTQDLDDLVRISEENNRKLHVSGFLMTAGGIFFQVIEGPDEAIDGLWEKIMQDDRHRDVLPLSIESGIHDRLFPDWSMKKIDLNEMTNTRLEPLRALLETVMTLRKSADDLLGVLERSAWNELTN